MGKCYYQLGMLREAEKQFLSALKAADMVTIVLELSKASMCITVYAKCQVTICFGTLMSFEVPCGLLVTSGGAHTIWTTTADDRLVQVYIRIDQPQTALQQYSQAAARQPGQMELLLGQARVHDALNDLEQGVKLYKQVSVCLAFSADAIVYEGTVLLGCPCCGFSKLCVVPSALLICKHPVSRTWET